MNIRMVGQIANLISFRYKNKNYYYTDCENDIVSLGRRFTAIFINVSKIKATSVRVRAEIDLEVNVESEISNVIRFADTATDISVVVEKCYTETPNTTEFYFYGSVSDNVTNSLTTKIVATPFNLLFDKQASVYTFMRTCNHTLGMGFCTVSLNDVTFTSTVVDIINNGMTLTLSRTIPAGLPVADENTKYAERGVIKRGSEMRAIMVSDNSSTNGNIQIKQKFQNIKIGDTVEIIPGCDGRSTTCKVKFNNFKDYFGFESVPGTNPFEKLT